MEIKQKKDVRDLERHTLLTSIEMLNKQSLDLDSSNNSYKNQLNVITNIEKQNEIQIMELQNEIERLRNENEKQAEKIKEQNTNMYLLLLLFM